MVDLASVLVDNGKDKEALSVLPRYFLKSPILPIPGFLQDSSKNMGGSGCPEIFENGENTILMIR